VASFDAVIPPGGEGKITLRINTRGYEGAHLWNAKVNTNDPRRNVVILDLKATVDPVITVSPRYVYLRGMEGERVVRAVTIRARTEKPLKIEVGAFTLEGKARYTLEEVEKSKKFIVRIENEEGAPRHFAGYLDLGTNYPERKNIRIRIRARFDRRKSVKGQPGSTGESL